MCRRGHLHADDSQELGDDEHGERIGRELSQHERRDVDQPSVVQTLSHQARNALLIVCPGGMESGRSASERGVNAALKRRGAVVPVGVFDLVDELFELLLADLEELHEQEVDVDARALLVVLAVDVE